MARTNALSILQQTPDVKAQLSELYSWVVDNVQKETLASVLKSQAYTGDPKAGSVEFKRFANSQSKDYGTARSAGKGDSLKAPAITVNLDVHREIVEEAARFDIDTFGAGNFIAGRADNHVDSMVYDLETAFFNQAVSEGTIFSTTKSELREILEQYIQSLETVQNEYIRGVPRLMMNMVCAPSFYGDIRDLLDTQNTANVDTAAEAFGTYHGVKIYSSVYLPADTKAVLMIKGAIAQPVVSYPYGEPTKIQQSNDYSVELFYDYGTKCLTPDLIFVYANS